MSTFVSKLGGPYARSLSRRISIEGKEILVLDDLFRARERSVLYAFLRKADFRCTTRDSFEPKAAHSIRWRLNFGLGVRRLPLFREVNAIVQAVSSLRPLALEQVYANFNLYGEIHYAHIDSAKGVTALYCANIEWEEAWQGETVFYDRGEAAYVVTPRPGRLVVFDASITHRGAPPGRDCFEPRLNIAFKFRSRTRPRVRTTSTGMGPTYTSVVRRVVATEDAAEAPRRADR